MRPTRYQYSDEAYVLQQTVTWIEEMLLDGELRVRDVPRELRVTNTGIYVTALRFSRAISCKRYVQDLELLYYDILFLYSDTYERRNLIDCLSNGLQFHDFKNEEEFCVFQESIREDVLQEMQRAGAVVREAIRKQSK